MVLRLPPIDQDRDEEEQVGLRPPRTGQDKDEEEQLGTQAAPIRQDRDEEEQISPQAGFYWSGQERGGTDGTQAGSN